MSNTLSHAVVEVHFSSRPNGMTRTDYLCERVEQFHELCKTHDTVSITGYFFKTDILRLYHILNYEIPDHLKDMKDVPGGKSSFFYTILYNPKMSGTAE
ncbi:MAG: hypothetical protein HFJ54_07785 [Clostridia bacterium]|nr:hypothetical protein [Clostridia bacterium]